MQQRPPLTPAVSPSDGAREKDSRATAQPKNSDPTNDEQRFSLSLSERERAGVRVFLVCLLKAKVYGRLDTLEL